MQTLDDFLKSALGSQVGHFNHLEVTLRSVLGVEELLHMGTSGLVPYNSTDLVPLLNQGVGETTSQVSIGTRNKDERTGCYDRR